MSGSPARRMRRAQQRQIAKQMSQAMRQPPAAVEEPAAPERAAERLQQMGVSHARSILWTPPAR